MTLQAFTCCSSWVPEGQLLLLSRIPNRLSAHHRLTVGETLVPGEPHSQSSFPPASSDPTTVPQCPAATLQFCHPISCLGHGTHLGNQWCCSSRREGNTESSVLGDGPAASEGLGSSHCSRAGVASECPHAAACGCCTAFWFGSASVTLTIMFTLHS